MQRGFELPPKVILIIRFPTNHPSIIHIHVLLGPTFHLPVSLSWGRLYSPLHQAAESNVYVVLWGHVLKYFQFHSYDTSTSVQVLKNTILRCSKVIIKAYADMYPILSLPLYNTWFLWSGSHRYFLLLLRFIVEYLDG